MERHLTNKKTTKIPKIIKKNIENSVKSDLEKELSVRVIAKKYSISVGFVSKIKEQCGLIGKTSFGGRPQKLLPATKRTIKRLIVSGAVETAIEANKVIADTLNITVSNETIRRSLKKSKFKAKAKVKKPLLTDLHKKKKLKFSKDIKILQKCGIQ